jgi:hypothetical protein
MRSRMSIKGRPGSWLTDALQRGDLATALGEASEISNLNLGDALALVVLMAARRHATFDRAAARWVGRLVLEHRLTLDELRVAVAAVAELPHHPEDARRRLGDVCARHGLPPAIGLPDRSVS